MNAVDIAVLVILLGSALFALMRGFVYEVLAVTGWVVAALAAFWGLPWVRPLVKPYISSSTLADIVGGGIVFLVVLLICSFITHAIGRRVQRSAIGSVDRSLGFAFGLVRGLALASLCFLLVTKLWADEPQILKDAKTRPLMQIGAHVIQTLLPAQISAVEDKAKGASQSLDDARQAKEIYERLQAPQPKGADNAQKDSRPSYDNRGLERLIETTK